MTGKRTKILFITSSLDGGGAEKHILNLCRYLGSIAVETEVITISPEKDRLENKFREEKIPVRYYPLASVKELLLPGRARELRKLVREIAPDIIHAHLFHAEVAGAVASLFSKAPYIVTRHCSGVEFEGARMTLARVIRRRIDLVVAVSEEAVKESLRGGHSRDRIVKLPSGIESDLFVPLDEDEKKRERPGWLKTVFPGGPEGDGIVVGTMAAMRRAKNLGLFLRLARRVADRHGGGSRRVRFVILGEGPDRKNLEAQAAGLHLDGIVSMPGFSREPWKILPLFDIFFLPSFIEGTPLALLEAMSCGVPCVASDVGDVAEVLGDAGLVAKSEDEGGLFDHLLTLINDPGVRLDLGRRSRSRVVTKYDITRWGEKMNDIYTRVLEEKSLL